MFLDNAYIIQHKNYSKEALIEEATRFLSLHSEEHSLFYFWKFILDWFNESAIISAQTSGSTGIPKTLFLEKEKMRASAKRTNAFFKLTQKDTALLALSCKYIGGKMTVVRALEAGLNLLYAEPNSNPIANFQNQKIDFAAFAPIQVYTMLQQNIESLRNVKNTIIGGGAISTALKKMILESNGSFYETFGMTETISHIALKKITPENNSFKALDGVQFYLNEKNCLAIRDTTLGIDFLETNDMVSLHSSTEFTFLGRADNIINSGGVKLFPEQIEEKIAAIFSSPFFIHGVSDEKLGEKCVLFIESTENIDIEHILKQLRSILAPYEVPKDIYILPLFLRTETEKIKRKQTAESYLKTI